MANEQVIPNQDEYMYVNYPNAPQGQGPQRNDYDRKNFIQEIKPELMVEVFRRKLMGQELIDGKWEYVESLRRDAITERGAWDISNLMLMVSSINMSISKLNDNQIRERLRFLVKETLIACLANWSEEDYNISNSAKLYQIKSMLMSNSIGVLNQAGGGSIQELFKTTVNENRTVSLDKKEPNKLARLFGFGNGGN